MHRDRVVARGRASGAVEAAVFVIAVVVAALCVPAPTARAWGTKEHIQLTRIAAGRLIADPGTPPAMRRWLLASLGGRELDLAFEKRYFLTARVGVFPRGADGVVYWSAHPDLVAMADRNPRKDGPFTTPERLLHFIDVEHFHPDPAKRAYADDLSARPRLADFPRDIADERYRSAGVLPFAVEYHYQQMVRTIREGKLADRAGQFPRDDHAERWAGYLAHYLADNTQPQHATEDYQSRSYFRKVTGADARKAPSVHSDLEWRMVDGDGDDHATLRAEQWELFVAGLADGKDPVDVSRTADPWTATLEVSLASYEALPLIGRAAVAAYPKAGPDGPGPWDAAAFFRTKGTYHGREMTVLELKARQQAWAVRRIEATWRAAWAEAHK